MISTFLTLYKFQNYAALVARNSPIIPAIIRYHLRFVDILATEHGEFTANAIILGLGRPFLHFREGGSEHSHSGSVHCYRVLH